MAQLFGVMRIGRDVEVRQTPSGESVANITMAYNYGKKGSDGNKQTEWIEAALWGKRAEGLAQYLVKGQQIAVTINDPHVETFQKKDGSTGVKVVGSISEIELVGGKPAGSAPREESRPARQPAARPAPARAAPAGAFDDMADDIPF